MSLGLAFDFDADDLHANRQGTITERQQQRLHDFRAATLHSHWQSGLVISGLLVVGTMIAFLAGNHQLATLGVWVTLMMAITFFLSFVMTRFSTRSMLSGKIRMAEGEVRLTIGNTRGGKAYGVRIGRQQFFVSKLQHEAFRKGQAYRVYYVDAFVKLILSAELL